MAAELVIPQEIFDGLDADDAIDAVFVGPYSGNIVIGRSEDGKDDVVAIVLRYAGRWPESTANAKDHVIEILNAAKAAA